MCFLLLTPKLNVPVLSPQGYNADFLRFSFCFYLSSDSQASDQLTNNISLSKLQLFV